MFETNLGTYPRTIGPLAMRWRVRLVEATALELHVRNRAAPTYDPGQGVVFIGGLDSALHALRANDGTELWRFQTLGPVEGTPVVSRGVVYVGADDGALYAIDTATGRMLWRFATVAEVVRPAVVTADSVYLVNADDTVFAVNRTSGSQRWRYHREAPGGITASGHAGLRLEGDRLYTGFSDGAVVAIDTGDGTPVWERDTSSDGDSPDGASDGHRAIDVDTTPVLLDGSLFAASQTQGLYALDPAGGGVRWRVEGLQAISGLATDGRDLYATSATLGLLRIDPTDGSVRWAQSLGSNALQEPWVEGETLLVPSSNQTLWVIRARDGEPLGGIGPVGVSGRPERAGDTLFTVSVTGVAYAWRYGAITLAQR